MERISRKQAAESATVLGTKHTAGGAAAQRQHSSNATPIPPSCTFTYGTMHTRGASLIDAALGVDSGARPPPASTSPSAGSASAAAATSPTQNAVVANTSWVGPVWGSFERNTGTWTPYSPSENALIERAFADPSTASA